MAGHRNAAHLFGVCAHVLFPLLEINGSRIGREHHELGEGDPGALGDVRRRLERRRTVARQPEDERAEHVDAVLTKLAQPLHERLAGLVEPLVDVLQPLGCDRLDADQRTLDVRAAHRVEERPVLGGLHRDLGEEDHVARQLREPRHQLESLGPQRLQLLQPRDVFLTFRHGQVFQRDGIEVVVGQRDEPEPQTPELDNLRHDTVDPALPRFLAVGTPHRAERTMLGAPADGLHGSPHVAALRQQLPARRHEAVGIDASALIGLLQRSAARVIEDLSPDEIAIAANDRVSGPELPGLGWIQRRVDAAEHDGRAPGVHGGSYLVAAQGVAGMDADADHVTGLYGVEIQRLQGLVDNLRPAIRGRCRPRQHEQPSRRDDADAERQVARVHKIDGHSAPLLIAFSLNTRGPRPHLPVQNGHIDGRVTFWASGESGMLLLVCSDVKNGEAGRGLAGQGSDRHLDVHDTC